MADDLPDTAVSDMRLTMVQVNDGWESYKAERGHGVIDDVIKCAKPFLHIPKEDLMLGVSKDAMEKLRTELYRRKDKKAAVTRFMGLQTYVANHSGYAVEVKEAGHE
jgi:hypothetical protein